MSYCSLSDIEKKRIPTDLLIQLTDEENLNTINEDTVNGCIDDAQVLFEGYVRGRYPLPLNPVPDLAASIVADLAAYGLFCLCPLFDMPKSIQERRDTALNLMARIQDGKMPLYEPATAPSGTGGNAVHVSGPARIFSRDSMRDL
jgi:phage gp36-like protein